MKNVILRKEKTSKTFCFDKTFYASFEWPRDFVPLNCIIIIELLKLQVIDKKTMETVDGTNFKKCTNRRFNLSFIISGIIIVDWIVIRIIGTVWLKRKKKTQIFLSNRLDCHDIFENFIRYGMLRWTIWSSMSIQMISASVWIRVFLINIMTRNTHNNS